MARVLIKPRKARPFFGRHPWVLDSAIDSIEGSPADGDVVDLGSDQGGFIARGIFNGRSRIHVRLYTWNEAETLDEAFWRRRLASALQLRAALGYDPPEGAARLVFSEGDGLSGLVVDRYGEYLVVQVTALALAVRLPQIVPMLVDLARPQGILLRSERDIVRAEGLELDPGLRWGRMPEGPVEILDQGLRYGVDLAEGQKTGLYLDQRENRAAAARLMNGRRVLDMFCYTGGFSLAAAALGKAREVLGFDSSQRAVTQARANAERNGLCNVRFESGDAFDTLHALKTAGERFDGLVLDPPKFARSRGGVEDALRAYARLNRLAIDVLAPGGILVTCSCSGHVTRDDFFFMLVSVAQQSGRDIQVLEQRGASADHPVSATCPETEYLKCFICRVL
ncbi:MAG: class I SAM-dependent rRNA methyltransferase [Thermoguttaceae bacterium]